MTPLPPIRPETMVTYGGDRVRGHLAEPGDAGELAALLSHASERGRAVTFRAGGVAFDQQSVNTDLVISLRRLRGCSFDAASAAVEVEAGTRWGEVVEGALRRGLFPRVVVTTTEASVGGTASTNGVSRFTPARGREGRHVLELELVAPSGEVLRCSQEQNRDVLRAALGGLGYLGAITRVRVALDRSDADQVRTRVVLAGGAEEVLRAVTPPFPEGTRYAALMPDLARGLAFESVPVRGERLRRYPLIHEPRSARRIAGEWLTRWPGGNRLIWWLAYRTWSRRPYVDPIRDFTFMMDGNLRGRRLGRRLGLAMRIVQQSFLLPPASAGEFLRAAGRALGGHGLHPTFSDVLFSPADDSPFCCSHGLSGYLVSVAFETSRPGRLEAIRRALVQLSSTCRSLGGRVHLTKHVHARAEDLAAMYAAGLPEMRRLKRRLDPRGVLRNHFLERTFPELAWTP